MLATNYPRILLLEERLSLVRIMDMHVIAPPSTPGQPNPVMPLTYSNSAPSIKIDRIIADGAILEFLSNTGKQAYRLVIDKLRLDGIGKNLPMPYTALVSNQMPPGKIPLDWRLRHLESEESRQHASAGQLYLRKRQFSRLRRHIRTLFLREFKRRLARNQRAGNRECAQFQRCTTQATSASSP